MSHNILLVDDSQVITKVLKHIALRANCQPTIAHSLQDVKILCENQAQRFYCAIVDYHLPDAPEGQAIDFVLALNIPVIVITGRVNQQIREQILRRKVIDYIPKENIQIYGYLRQLLSRLQSNYQYGVLVVDDSRVVRNDILKLLERHNFKTYCAENAEQAQLVLKQQPDIKVVLVDEHMPDKNGVAFVVDIRCEYSLDELVVIGISGKDDSALSARFIKSGANDYLSMPFCQEEFFCRLYHNLERLDHIELIKSYANTDPLTGLNNRRKFFNSIEKLDFDDAQTKTLAIIDIDHFKSVNDSYGHQAGDELLIAIADTIKQSFPADLTARVGGEEFCVFFVGVSQLRVKHSLLNFIEKLAQGVFCVNSNSINITVSVGAVFGAGGSHNQYYAQADRGLYQAKHNGRNQLVIAPYTSD